MHEAELASSLILFLIGIFCQLSNGEKIDFLLFAQDWPIAECNAWSLKNDPLFDCNSTGKNIYYSTLINNFLYNEMLKKFKALGASMD